jgi:hypothetical protein
VDLLFAADILLTFVTAYFHEGEIIYDIRKIANNYICGWFFIDFIATFPMQLLIPEGKTQSPVTALLKNLNRTRHSSLHFSKLSRHVKQWKSLVIQHCLEDWTTPQNSEGQLSFMC